MRLIAFHQTAFDDFGEWAQDNKALRARQTTHHRNPQNPFDGIGKPEPLKHELKGYRSRRITDKHRPVYKVTDEQIIIIFCKYHYD